MNEEVKDDKVPTLEEMVSYLKKQIVVAELRASLSKLQRDTAIHDFEKMEALVKLDFLKNPERYGASEELKEKK
jgi:hypothetical protein